MCSYLWVRGVLTSKALKIAFYTFSPQSWFLKTMNKSTWANADS